MREGRCGRHGPPGFGETGSVVQDASISNPFSSEVPRASRWVKDAKKKKFGLWTFLWEATARDRSGQGGWIPLAFLQLSIHLMSCIRSEIQAIFRIRFQSGIAGNSQPDKGGLGRYRGSLWGFAEGPVFGRATWKPDSQTHGSPMDPSALCPTTLFGPSYTRSMCK